MLNLKLDQTTWDLRPLQLRRDANGLFLQRVERGVGSLKPQTEQHDRYRAIEADKEAESREWIAARRMSDLSST